MPLSTGKMLKKRYRIERLIKQGGFGAVYLAHDTKTGTQCAIKENLDTSLDAQRLFKKEAEILATLSHPNLPPVTAFFNTPDGQYLVMEYVEGDDLQEILEQLNGRGLPINQVMSWIGQTCDALKYLHTCVPPVIHRDIKPGNIRVTASGQAKLVDFGIAKVYIPGLATTNLAQGVGTEGYSPPEQFNRGGTDARSDLYALAATIYALLSGVAPPACNLRSAGTEELVPLTQLCPSLPVQSEVVISKAMELRVDQRYGSVDEFWKELRRAVFSSKDLSIAITPDQRRTGAMLRMRRALQSNDSRRIAAAYYPEVKEVYLTLSIDERRMLETALTQYPWLIVTA
jgi:serine/threonine protein kinase